MKKGLFILLSLLCILEIDAQDTTIIKQPNIQTNAANLLPPGNCTITGATSVTGGQSYAYSLACVLSGDVTWRVNGGVLTSYSNTTANVKWTGGFIEVSNPLEGIGGGLALSGPNNSIETPTWLNILSDITTGQLEAISNGIVVASIEVSIRTVVLKGGTISPSLSHIAYNGNPGVLTYSGATGGSTSYSYQWQVSSDGYTWSNLTGVTGLTYSPGTLQNNAFYRVLVLQNSVSVGSSSNASVLVTLVPGIISPVSKTIADNTSPGSLTATPAKGGSVVHDYQWQSSSDNIIWSNIAGANGLTFSPGNMITTTRYRLQVDGTAMTNVSAITVTGGASSPVIIAGNINTTIDLTKAVGTSKGEAAIDLNGDATYKIPLEVTPGTNGMQPYINLEYNSSVGEGIAGWSWQLSSLSIIKRSGKNSYYNGVSAPVKYDNSEDAFVLDGQRLFPISGSNGANQTIYGRENEDFSKIESFGGSEINGPDYFTVTTKDGSILEYGHATNSKMLTNDGQSVMLWLLNKVTDKNGNYMLYQYNIDLGRRSYVLTEIDYTGNSISGLSPYNKVVFHYSLRSDGEVITRYQASASIVSPYLLDEIDVLGRSGTNLKSYKCAYSLLHGTYFLRTFAETGSDGQSLNPLKFNYGSDTIEPQQYISPTFDDFVGNSTIYSGNFHGDGTYGLVDAFYQTTNNGLKQYSGYDMIGNFGQYGGQPSLSFDYHENFSTNTNSVFGGNNGNYDILTNDYDGDGKSDVLIANYTLYSTSAYLNEIQINYTKRVYALTPVYVMDPVVYSFLPTVSGYSGSFRYMGNTYIIPGDFDGDGVQDYILILGLNSSNEFKAFFNSPKKGIVNKEITDFGVGGSPSAFYANTIAAIPSKDIVPMDFDGDGKADILVKTAYGCYIISVSKSSTGTYSCDQLYSSYSLLAGDIVFPGDFNADGLTDLLVRNAPTDGSDLSYGAWNVLYSTGKDFNSYPFIWTNRPILDGDGYAASNMVMVADLNNDGKSDVWQSLDFNNGGTGVLNSSHTIYYSHGEPLAGSNSLTAFDWKRDTAVSSVNLTSGEKPVFGDFNGDGHLDVISIQGPDALFIYTEPKKEEHNIVSTLNGLGAESNYYYDLMNNDISYSMSNKYYYDTLGKPPGQGVNGHPYNVINGPKYIVSRLLTSNGIGGLTSKEYNYTDLVLDPTRGILGFNKINEINGATGIHSMAINEIDYRFLVPKMAVNFRTDEYGDTIEYSSFTDTLLAASSIIGDKGYIHQVRRQFQFDGLKGSATQTDNTYDLYGNVTQSIVKTGAPSGNLVTTPVMTKTTTSTYVAYGTPVPAYPTTITLSSVRTGQTAAGKNITYSYDPKGNVISKTDFAGTAKAVTSTFTYDNFGNASKLVLSSSGLSSRTAQNSMDAQGRFILKQQRVGNGLTKTKTFTYDDWGDTLSYKTTDGLTYNSQYNGFYRPIKKMLPEGYNIALVYNWESAIGRYSVATTQPGGGPNQKIYFDLLGREVMKQLTGFNGQLLKQIYSYDYAGQLSGTSKPYYPNETPVAINYTYDRDSRLTKISYPVKYVSYAFNKLSGGNYKVTTTNSAGQSTSKTEDASGNIVSASDNGGNISYTYDSWGNRLKVTIAGNVMLSNVYDSYGQLSSSTDINAGIFNYQYDGFGQLILQKDPLNHTSTFNYDDFGRLTSRVGTEGTTTFTYFNNSTTGSNDNLSKIVGFSGDVTDYTYDNLNRALTKKQTVDGSSYTTTYAYDAYSNLIKTTYSDGVVINNSFDNNRLLKTVVLQSDSNSKTLFTGTSMNGAGIYTGYFSGNGKTSQVTYDLIAGTPTRFYTAGIQDLNFVYDPNTSNLTSRKDGLKNLTETFTYDNLNRLAGSKMGTAEQLGLQYDNASGTSLGNIQLKSDAGKYVYNSSKINEVAYIIDTGSNQLTPPPNISLDKQQIGYTPFLKTDSIAQDGNVVHFTYGSDYNRIKSIFTNNGALTETRYYFGNFEKQVKGSTIRYIHYVPGGNGLCAIVVKEGTGTTPYFVYEDRLGSILTLTDTIGHVVASQNFDPWGRNRNPTNWSYSNIPAVPQWFYRGYTGHEQLPQFALINMNGRMYDPVQGRMLSPDPFVQFPYSTQGYNRYSYVTNNPLLFSDLSGLLEDVTVTAYPSEGGGIDPNAWNDLVNSIGNSQPATWVTGGGGGGGVGDGTAKPKTITVKTKDGKTVVITLKKPLSKEQLAKLQKLGIIIDATGNAIATTTNSVLSIQKLVNEASGTSYEIINLEKLGLEIGNIGKITLKNAGDLLTIFSMGLSMDNMVQNGLNWTDGTNFVMTATAFIPEVGWAIAGGYWIANLIIENRTGFQIGHFVEIGANYEQKQWDKFPETSPLSHPFFP